MITQESNVTCDIIDNFQNWTDSQVAGRLLYSTTETLLVTAIIPTVFVVGFLGNVVFILSVIRVKTMRTMTNFYLTNLAAADLMILSVELFYRSWRYKASIIGWSQPFRSAVGCGMYFFAINLTSSASIFLICVVTFDRYFAVCHPLKYRIMKSKKHGPITITLPVWIISALLGILSTPGFSRLLHICFIWPLREKYATFPKQAGICAGIYPAFSDVSHVVRTAPFIVAFITNTVITIMIVFKLIQPAPGENSNSKSQQMKRRVTWMVMANNAIFFCCLAPSHFLIFQLVKFIGFPPLPEAAEGKLFLTAFMLFMVNSAINPILYGLASPRYRRGFLKAFGLARNQIEPTDDDGTASTNLN